METIKNILFICLLMFSMTSFGQGNTSGNSSESSVQAEKYYSSGTKLYQSGRMREAETEFEKAADLGHTDAMVRYADCLKIVAQADLQNAITLAATTGNIYLMTTAQESATSSFILANTYYQRAADAGNVTAMKRLGYEYSEYLRNNAANSSSSRTPGTSKESYEEKCYLCKGFRYTPDFRSYGGRGERSYCSTCGRTETTHDHYVCTACNGSGTKTKTRLK